MGPLRGSGVRALRRDSRATKTEPETGAVEPISERKSGKGWSVCGRKGCGEYIGQTGGNEGESEIGAEEIHMRRGKRMNLGHVGGERGRDNRTQGRGRKPRETSGNKGGETRGGASIET